MTHVTLAEARAQHSQQRLDQLRSQIQKLEVLQDFPTLTVYGVGSYARLEASEHSDLDLFFLTSDDLSEIDDPRTKSLRLFGEIIEIAQGLGFPKFSNDCEYLTFLSTADILKNLGNPSDDHQNYFTARMLLLLESHCLHNETCFDEIIRRIISSYFRDYPDHPETFWPLFLLNDIGRFWKTLLLNYEHKRRQEPDKPIREEVKTKQKVRNFKLKYSRLTTCFASIVALGSRSAPVTEDDVFNLTKLTPRTAPRIRERPPTLRCPDSGGGAQQIRLVSRDDRPTHGWTGVQFRRQGTAHDNVPAGQRIRRRRFFAAPANRPEQRRPETTSLPCGVDVASVSLLEINDATVAPHLELLRRVCDPKSASKPHITVRYFDKLEVPQDHLDTTIRHIDILKPGTFHSKNSHHRVVFIKCDSEELVGLEHKPHFPASEFHITLYEGDDVEFAGRLLLTLRQFQWMFRVRLPDRTTLKHIQLKRTGTHRVTARPNFGAALRRLFFEVADRPLTWGLIDGLASAERLYVAHEICASLHRLASGFTHLPTIAPNTQDRIEEHSQQWEPDVHLTPPELATAIAAYAVSLLEPADAPVHFGDPAVGNGAFYAALLQELPRSRIASAVGVDISPRQVDAARSRWGHRGLQVMQADYLHLERLQPRSLILANPPYLRHQDIPASYKKQLRERASVIMGTVIDAKSGQYVYFLILSHRWLAEDGVAAWLVPSGFMRALYGRDVRRYLTEEVTLIRIHQFSADDPQFENAKVLPVVVVFRKAVPERNRRVMLSVGGTLDAPMNSRFVSIGALRREERWSVSSPSETSDGGVHIGDLFSVSRGIATGANDFFILTRQTALALGLPSVALRPILPKSRLLNSNVIERNEDGWPAVDPQMCVVDCALTEEEIAVRFPALRDYLAAATDRGILKRNLVRHRKPWYKQERRRPAMFLCTYMGRGTADRLPLRFIWNKSDAIATNTYLMMYPNEELAALLADSPRAQGNVLDSLQRAASETICQLSRTYSGGLQKIEPRELLQVSLPCAPEWLLRIVGAGDKSDRLWAEGDPRERRAL